MTANDDLKASNSDKSAKSMTENNRLKSFLLAFIFPTLILKSLLLYFGLQYSNYPGEGYGYGLVTCLAFSVGNAIRFVYKNRDIEEL